MDPMDHRTLPSMDMELQVHTILPVTPPPLHPVEAGEAAQGALKSQFHLFFYSPSEAGPILELIYL